MSGASSSVAAWYTLLERAPTEKAAALVRADDPRLGEIIEYWDGDPRALRAGRAVIVGFPQDEGVRRNGGRVGAARAPDEIRQHLYRLTTFHAKEQVSLADCPPLDAGNVRIAGTLEHTQEALGSVVAGILTSGAVPVVLGGGHETAYGHYLGYAHFAIDIAIINIDAHLDVRPLSAGLGHSGSPFRQAFENMMSSLAVSSYVCIGAQPFAVAWEHFRYVTEREGAICWAGDVEGSLAAAFTKEKNRVAAGGRRVFLTLDADAFSAADVPGVSAPNPAGFRGSEAAALTWTAGRSPEVSSFELVETNPVSDVDARSVRWAAMAIWHFLAGLACRGKILERNTQR
jgi:formiminoglutamase